MTARGGQHSASRAPQIHPRPATIETRNRVMNTTKSTFAMPAVRRDAAEA
jgi:hypothetical protein